MRPSEHITVSYPEPKGKLAQISTLFPLQDLPQEETALQDIVKEPPSYLVFAGYTNPPTPTATLHTHTPTLAGYYVNELPIVDHVDPVDRRMRVAGGCDYVGLR